MSYPSTAPSTCASPAYVTSTRPALVVPTFTVPQAPISSTGFPFETPAVRALNTANTASMVSCPPGWPGVCPGSLGAAQMVNVADTSSTPGYYTPLLNNAAALLPGPWLTPPLACACPPTSDVLTTWGSGLTTPITTSTSGFLRQPIVTSASAGILFTPPAAYPGPQALQGFCGQRLEIAALKENEIPREIVETVDVFRKFVLAQKELSHDISMRSMEPVCKVQTDVESAKSQLCLLSLSVTEQMALANKLKFDIAECLQHAKMALRTRDTSLELQPLNTAPLRYFWRLISKLDAEIALIVDAMDNARKHLRDTDTQPTRVTQEELHSALRSISHSLTFLAARIHTLHTEAETQSHRYLDLRRHFVRDTAATELHSGRKESPPTGMHLGPTPFPAIGLQLAYGALHDPTSDVQQATSTS